MSENQTDVRAVCFDAGNVLCCFGHKRVSMVLESFGHEVSREKFAEAELCGRDAINALLASSPEADNMAQVLCYLDRILEELGIAPSARPELVEALLGESDKLTLWCEAPEEAPRVLSELAQRGYSLAVISNTAKGDCQRVLSEAGLVEHFAHIIDSFHVGIEKPDPRIFQLAAEKLGLDVAEIVFVGDIYEVDAVGAKRAGMMPILLDPRGRTQGRDCTVIRSLGELLELL